jgi:hypothetical protein
MAAFQTWLWIKMSPAKARLIVTGAGTAVVIGAGIVEVSITGANVLGVVAWLLTAGAVTPFPQAAKVRPVITAMAETRRRRFTRRV